MVHAIVNGKAGYDASTGTVDVQVDRFGVVLLVEVKQYSDDLIGQFIVDFLSQEDDAFAVEAVVNVDPVGAAASWYAVCDLWYSDGHHCDFIGAGGLAPWRRGYRLGALSQVQTGDE